MWRLLIVAGALLVGLVVAGWAWDLARGDVVADGVRAGPVPLGGLSGAAARRRLESTVAVNERHPIKLVARGRRLRVVPAKLGLTVDIDRIVAQAQRIGRGGGFVGRDWRLITGAKVHAAVVPELTPRSAAAVRRIALRLERRPHNAAVEPTPATLHVVPSQSGVAVESGAATSALAAALLSGAHTITLPAHRMPPAVTLAALRHRYPAYITIDRAAFTLRVYQRLRLVRTYPIAVGMQGLQTPAGLYHIQNKVVDPAWSVPNSPWAGSLAGQVIPPGPSDPLKARWMGLFNGAGIHGTDEVDSIGHAFSHGCVRMLIPDAIDLYDRVKVGTPVYIGD